MGDAIGGFTDIFTNPIDRFTDIFDPKQVEQNRVRAGEGFELQEVQGLIALLKNMLQGEAATAIQGPLAQRGLEQLAVTPESRVAANQEIAQGLARPAADQAQASIARSLGGRGLGASGAAFTDPSVARNQSLTDVLNSTLQRSFEESQQANTLGGSLLGDVRRSQLGFSELLTSLISQLGSTGIAGQAGNFNAEEGTRGDLFTSFIQSAGS